MNCDRPLRLAFIAAAVAGVFVSGCKQGGRASGEVSRNWQPPQQAEYLGVPAATVHEAIQKRLSDSAPPPVTADVWKHVKKLYAAFGENLLWLNDRGVHEPRVAALLNTVANADSDALRLDSYPLAALGRALNALGGTPPTAEQLANADVLLSAAFATYGENMLTGQVSPVSLGQSWHINPLEEHVDSALTFTLREDDLGAGLVRMRPQDSGYDSLRVELERYRTLVTNGGWDTVSISKQLRRGDAESPARLEALRARLRVEGYAVDSATKPRVYDAALAGAVATFQARHGINVDSMLGKETVDAMNVPAQYRLAQIAANLERYRWMPRSLGDRYIIVNVPQFQLTAYDSGQASLEMKVIVGQEYEDKATPVFSDSMEYVVFRPYWNVTPDIAAKEVFPKGPGYLAANDMEIYYDQGRRSVRQRPGPKNALGFVKFIFPNDYNIYLHDTPNHELFQKDIRAFSHGCIRVAKADQLAQWVLGWPLEKVDSAMHGADNHQVTLPRKIPVYIVYFTTYVKGGSLYFGNDLYARDGTLVQGLSGAAISSPQTVQAQQALRAMETVKQ